MAEIFLPTSHPLHLPDDIWALLLYLPTSHLLDWTCTLWSHPGVPSPLPPRLWTLLQLPKSTSKSMHLTNLPMPWELRLDLSYSYTENFINHHCSSDVMGNYPVSHTKGANLSMLVVCAPGSHGDLAWPRCGLALAARYLLSKTHIFRSVDLLRPAPASHVVSLQAEVKILLFVEKNSCRSLAFLQIKAELIPHSSKNQNNKFHVSLQLLWPCTMICAGVRSI